MNGIQEVRGSIPLRSTSFRRPQGSPRRMNPEDIRVWRYALPGGFTALAGKTDDDNECLSLKVARKGTGNSTIFIFKAAACTQS